MTTPLDLSNLLDVLPKDFSFVVHSCDSCRENATLAFDEIHVPRGKYDTLRAGIAVLTDLAREQAGQIEALTKANRILELKNAGTLANNLCPDCRDKQARKPCLGCTIQTQAGQIERLRLSLIDMMGAVKVFHGPECWEIYEQNAPEIIRARAALAQSEGGAK